MNSILKGPNLCALKKCQRVVNFKGILFFYAMVGVMK